MGFKRLSKIVFLLTLPGLVAVFAAKKASAIPSFARQTGLPCSACHTMFPELTPFGREFKLEGYTLNKTGAKHPSVPPLAAMVQFNFTHTNRSVGPADLPENRWSLHALTSGNNVLGSPNAASVFYGGQIYGHWGAFIQATYSDKASAPYMALDNTDIRYADTSMLLGKSLIYGLDFNNNPTVEDVWNSTPAWGYPYNHSNVAASPVIPVAAPILEQGLAAQVGGAGAYVYWDNLVYCDFTLYRTALNGITAPFGAGNHPLGVYTTGAIPYWRLAITHQSGANSYEMGTYGLLARAYANYPFTPDANNYSDVAFDAEYQHIISNQSFSLETTWIHENQDNTGSVLQGLNNDAYAYLDTFTINGNYYYRTTHWGEIGGTIDYFTTTGSDNAAYAIPSLDPSGNPDSKGETLELDYMPPWHHYGPTGFGFAKFALQYTIFNQFNGTSTGASGYNTLYLLAFFVF
jgi:hypothetical protein